MANRKSPAFSFYPDSWFGGTMLMTPAQKGIYIDLLAIQWVKGGFSREQALLVLRGVTEDDVDAVLSDKFEETKSNWFSNPRLREEQEKQANRREKLSANGKKGGRPKKQTESKSKSKTESRTKPTEKPSVSVSDSVLDTDSGSDSNVVKGGKRPTTQIERPSEVSEVLWREWLAVRRAKRSGPVTATAWKAVEREAAIAGLAPVGAVQIAVENSWSSFKAAWHSNSKQQQKNNGKQTAAEIAAEIRRDIGQPQPAQPELGGFLN